MKLKELLVGIEYTVTKGSVDIEIKGVAYDSRKVKEGYIFVAVKGYQTDGHNYIDKAFENGAVAVIGETDFEGKCCIRCKDTRKALAIIGSNFYHNPKDKLKIIGVTGTNGKTTTTYLIREILELKGYKSGVIGTNKIIIDKEEYEANRTTPESLELHEIMAKMVEKGVNYLIMEVSSHSLVLDRVYGIDFEAGVFTNLTQDHLDFHKTMDEYAKAKAILFSHSKYSVLNADDKYFSVMKASSKGTVKTYGIKKNADVMAENIKMSARGVIFNVNNLQVRLGIPGEFSVYNALSAICVCSFLGLSMDDIAKGLVIAHGVKGRMEVVYAKTPYTIIIDYAHTPDALENVIKAINNFKQGKLITLFGCGGDRDKTKRPKMGKIATEMSDFTIITSDNPRNEEPLAIINDILTGVEVEKNRYTIVLNRKEAIKYAMDMAGESDIILLAGKGHETYQILKNETIEFDERKIIKEICESL